MSDTFGDRIPLDAREALYRENARARQSPARLAPEAIGDDTSVAVLGLEQGTISRLYRCGIVRLADLLDHGVEDLWRRVGRHGIADILERLERLGIPLPSLTDQARWRLGLLSREAAVVTLDADTPVADLWPRLGQPLVDTLLRRGLLRLRDLAPQDDEAVLQLYRLGRANLGRIRELLEATIGSTEEADHRWITTGIEAIRQREQNGRRRPRGAEPEPLHDRPTGRRTASGSPGGIQHRGLPP
jgi:hypothetical protein